MPKDGVSPAGKKKSLTPAMVNILVALASGEKHGYGIMVALDEMTGGHVRLGPGTLYRSLRQLLDMDLIETAPAGRGDDDPRRIPYRLTSAGREMAVTEAQKLAVLVQAAKAGGLLGRRAGLQGAD